LSARNTSFGLEGLNFGGLIWHRLVLDPRIQLRLMSFGIYSHSPMSPRHLGADVMVQACSVRGPQYWIFRLETKRLHGFWQSQSQFQ